MDSSKYCGSELVFSVCLEIHKRVSYNLLRGPPALSAKEACCVVLARSRKRRLPHVLRTSSASPLGIVGCLLQWRSSSYCCKGLCLAFRSVSFFLNSTTTRSLPRCFFRASAGCEHRRPEPHLHHSDNSWKHPAAVPRICAQICRSKTE